jgi:hypothetical protein
MILILLLIISIHGQDLVQQKRDDYAKRETAVLALKSCLTKQQADNVLVVAAKAACRTEAGTDAGLGAALQAWKSDYNAEKKIEIVNDWYRDSPQIKTKIELLFPIAIDSASVSEIVDVIGATGSTEDIAADVKQYQQQAGAETWVTAVKTCKLTATDKLACVTSDANIVDLCTRTANSLKCCGNGNSIVSTCGKTDALRVVTKVAEEQLSNTARSCSRIANTTPEAVQTCIELATETFTVTTGKVVDKVSLKEKLTKGAKYAVGEAVKVCMGNIDTDLTVDTSTVQQKLDATAARKDCRGGEAAKTAMAETLGKSVLDVTTTDAVKYARDGAKEVGKEKMKTFSGTLSEKLTAAKTDMAAAVGKVSDCTTWTKECMTDVDAKKAITNGAQDCMTDAVAACVADIETSTSCSYKSQSVKDAVFDCTGLTTMTDEKLGRMQEKAKAGKVIDAYKAALESCTGTVSVKASCVKTSALRACTSAKGSTCGEMEVILGRNKGAAKEMAETAAACRDADETECTTAKKVAYEAVTGKLFTASDAAKLQKKGARGEVADLMNACFATKVGVVEQRKCSNPTELPEIKEAFAAALGKTAADITNTEYKAAIVEGVKSDIGLAIGGCLGSIASSTVGSARTLAVKACHTDVVDEVRAGLGKPDAADISENQVRYFLQESGKDLEKNKFEACFEDAASAGDADAVKLAQNNCRGRGATAVEKRTAFKYSCGQPAWTDIRAEKEMRDNTLNVVADDFVNCMYTNAPKVGTTKPSNPTIKTAFSTCKTTTKTKRALLTGEPVNPIKAQKDCVRAAKRKVSETVEACKEASGTNCGDPANNPDLLFRLKLMTGKVDITNTEARALVKKSGNSAAGDFMKTCMDNGTLATCLSDGKKAMGAATGEVVDNKALVGGLREAAKEEVADAVVACVASGKTRDSTECKKAKVDAFKATGLGDGKTEKQIKRMVEKSLIAGAQKSMLETKLACLDLAADNATAKTACNTNEIRTAKIAKSEAEGIPVADIPNADVVKDLEKGKEEDTSSAMEACTEKAMDATATRECVTAVEIHVAVTEGQTIAVRRRLADLTPEKQNMVKERMRRASENSFANKMNACMEAAELETGSDIATAKTTCKDTAEDMFTQSTGKIGTDIREGDVEMIQEDAAIRAFTETNIAIAKAMVDGETYTDDEKRAATAEAVRKVKGEATTSVLDKSRRVGLRKKAGARALGDKAVACVMATTSDAEALTACSDANLMEEKRLASGQTAAVTNIVDKERAKREAVKELLKYGLKAHPEDHALIGITDKATKVATLLKRPAKMFNDKKQAVAELICDRMKTATGTKKEKRTKMKAELKRISEARDGSRLDEVTDEELDAVLDMGATDILATIDDCTDKETCRNEVEITLKAALGCKVQAVKAKKNQIAKLVAAQEGADIKAADDAKTADDTTPVKTEEEIEALMKAKFESVGGVPGTFDAYKVEIKKAKRAYVLNKDIVIKKKPSIDIVVAYDGACVAASEMVIKTSLEAVDTDMHVEKVGTPTVDVNDNKCKTIYRAKRKTGKPATSDELKGVLTDKYTSVTLIGRRLNGRHLQALDTSADQTTEVEDQPTDQTPTVTPNKPSTDNSPSDNTSTESEPEPDTPSILSESEGHTVNLTIMFSTVMALVVVYTI